MKHQRIPVYKNRWYFSLLCHVPRITELTELELILIIELWQKSVMELIFQIFKKCMCHYVCGLGQCNWYSNLLQAGWSGDRILVGGEIFRICPDRPWGPCDLLYNGYRVFPRGKASRAWRWPPTPSSVEVKVRVELNLYSPSGPSWPVLGWTLPLSFMCHIYG